MSQEEIEKIKEDINFVLAALRFKSAQIADQVEEIAKTVRAFHAMLDRQGEQKTDKNQHQEHENNR